MSNAWKMQPDPRRFQHIRDLLRLVREELRGELPVLVFAGAPFTVATYSIGTGKDIAATRRFAAEQPRVWDALLDRLTTATIHFLRTLIDDGADVYQLFDSWAGLAGARGIPDVGAAASRGDIPGGERSAAHPVRQGRAVFAA